MKAAIERDAQTMIDIIREGYAAARAARSTVHAVVDRQNHAGYRFVQKVHPNDTVLVTNIKPPAWDPEISRAAIAASSEFRDAKPALNRAAELIAKNYRGELRPAPEIAEIAEEMMRQALDDLIPPYQDPGQQKKSWFTRLFGSAT